MLVEIGPYSDEPYGDRKINVSIDSYDTWNLDHTLALIILPSLKKFKDNHHNIHYVCNKDVPKELRTEETNCLKKWNYVLDTMINSFEEVVLQKEDINQDGLILFGKYFTALWD